MKYTLYKQKQEIYIVIYNIRALTRNIQCNTHGTYINKKSTLYGHKQEEIYNVIYNVRT